MMKNHLIMNQIKIEIKINIKLFTQHGQKSKKKMLFQLENIKDNIRINMIINILEFKWNLKSRLIND